VPLEYASLAPNGEAVANQLGWIPLLEKWLAVAQQPGANSLANEPRVPGDPTNRKLSEGIAFLLDLAMPV
jgi:hypothetical protein